MTDIVNNWKIVIFMALTLGLTPFFPEPHIVGKIRWVMGGAHGMAPMDYVDLLLHGLPWVLVIRLGFISLLKAGKKEKLDIQQ